ncbi:radical SAM protein [bacterium]|nr:radical SAM protein [bacterium]
MVTFPAHISFTSTGNELFLINHQTGYELLLNSDAADVIRLIEEGEKLPNEVHPFIKELKKMGFLSSRSGDESSSVSKTTEHNLHLYEQIKARATKSNIPFSAHLELTRRCPLSCKHCYLRDVPTERERELSTVEWIALIEQLYQRGAFHITITGGEPFARRDTVEIIRAIRKRRMALSILSSGAAVSDGVAEQVAAAGPMVWQTSIYGDEERHDALTDVVGSFQQMMKVARFMKKKKVTVRMTFVVMATNIKYLKFIEELAVFEGFVLSFNTTLMAGLGGTPPPENLTISRRELQKLIAHIGCSDAKDVAADTAPCDAARSVVAVNHRGDIYPCIEWREAAGNIRKDSFADVWSESPLFRSIRHLANRDIIECNSCDYRQYCHRCPGHTLRQGNTMVQKDEWACEKAEICFISKK